MDPADPLEPDPLEPGALEPRRRFGYEYEEFVDRVFLAAVERGVATRAGLLEAGLTPAEVEEGVAELLARGFLVREPDPDSWAVVPPRESFGRHLERVERRAALMRATMTEIDSVWRRAVGRGVADTLPDVDLVAGIPDLVDRVVVMHHGARRRLWWAVDASVASRALLEQSLADPGLLAVRDGVDVRIVIDTALLEVAGTMELMERAGAAGHGVRVGNGIPLSAVLSDDSSALIDISSYDPEGFGSFEVHRAAPVQAVARLIEEIWTLSTPFAPTVEALRLAAQGRPAAPLDERDRRVLALLATGAPDQLIARQTGVSVRTVERRVRYVMEHLGAATRFQAGVQAVRRGWV